MSWGYSTLRTFCLAAERRTNREFTPWLGAKNSDNACIANTICVYLSWSLNMFATWTIYVCASLASSQNALRTVRMSNDWTLHKKLCSDDFLSSFIAFENMRDFIYIELLTYRLHYVPWLLKRRVNIVGRLAKKNVDKSTWGWKLEMFYEQVLKNWTI